MWNFWPLVELTNNVGLGPIFFLYLVFGARHGFARNEIHSCWWFHTVVEGNVSRNAAMHQQRAGKKKKKIVKVQNIKINLIFKMFYQKVKAFIIINKPGLWWGTLNVKHNCICWEENKGTFKGSSLSATNSFQSLLSDRFIIFSSEIMINLVEWQWLWIADRTKKTIWKCHLGLQKIVMSTFPYFLTLNGLNNLSVHSNRKQRRENWTDSSCRGMKGREEVTGCMENIVKCWRNISTKNLLTD